ncbi:sensor histidine kinase [Paenibacillus sacheonensis]|uniref:HAMP domain-containing protein n=1 Tax=Paenibacillus sacheonensis TaxID=742054 RepID=A0A7X5BYR6_9BACL|nr:sensor histidine kinase [Paenibacillus sacheonensis]MBM7565282.1 two-component system sensor histidine kinase YesM [Paenibacillus sacheonensis]NBC69947.1 HAMP domain-containing protein [Paenibacillus sacheonensis]
MRKVRRFFVDAKLRTKFLLSFTVIILVTVLMISGINYWVSVGAIKRNSAEFSQYLISQIGINLDKRTTDVEQMAFQQFRSSSLGEKLKEMPVKENDVYFRDTYINDFLNELLFNEDYFLSVFIIDGSSKRYSIQRKAVVNYNQELMERLDLKQIQDMRGRALWFRGANDTLYMARALYDIETSKYVGIIAIGLESDYIGSIVTGVHNLMDGDVLILNGDNRLFVPGEVQGGAGAYYLNEKLYLSDTGKEDFKFGGRRYISSVLSTDYDKWKVVQIIDVGQLTRGTESIKYWTISTILVSLLFAFLMAALISKNITRSIRRLLQSMTLFSLDFQHSAIKPMSRDEVGLLTAKFNSMAEKINDLFNSVYREKMLKQKAEYRTLQFEYKALQAQMNPHFLYNTLEAIHSMAKIKGEEEIGELIYLLGKLLRESIGKKGDTLPLEEELDFIRSYLSIHKIIYGDRIELNYAVDERLTGCRVPKFILQPLVENAIVHGIEEKPGKALIRIVCREEGGDLLLEVSDNGVGMEAAKVDRLLSPERYGTVDGENKHTNVGIISVHKRIRILYGDGYGLAIGSAVGEGTTVRVRLPVVAEEGIED